MRLGIIEDFDSDVTPVFLMTLAKSFPDCRFVLETGPSHRLLGKLEARAVDMVVTADMERSSEQQTWCETHELMQEPFVLVAPKGHFPSKGARLLDLQNLPMIQYATRHVMGRLLARHIVAQKLNFEARFELDNYQAILAMVAEGVGWTILTPLALQCAAQFMPAVDVLPLPFASFNRRISLSARKAFLRVIPQETAFILRNLLQRQVVNPWCSQYHWLENPLSILPPKVLVR